MDVLNERGKCGGRTLQQIAEAFFHSPERQRVWDYAKSIDIQSLDYNSFSLVLLGLFQVCIAQSSTSDELLHTALSN